MKVTIERLPESRVQLDVEVDQERVDKQFDAAFRRLAPKVRVPGFRPGKAPRAMIEKHIGRERIMAEALDKLVPDVYNEVLDTEPVDAVAQPTLDKVDLDPMRLKFIVAVRPTVTLGDYQAIRVAAEPVEVTDEEVAEQILSLRRRHATQVPVERGAAWDDILIAKVRGTVGEDEFISDEDAEFPLREGEVLVVDGLSEAFVGMKKDATKSIELPIPEDFALERVRGQQATFEIAVLEVKEVQLPAEDDELAGLVNAEEFDSLQALKDRVRADILASKQAEEDQRIRSAAIDQLVEGATIEYPAVMVDHEVDHVIRDVTGTEARQYAAQLQRIGRSEAEFRAQFFDAGVARLKRGLVLSKLTEAEAIEVTPDDIDGEIEKIVGPMEGEDGQRFRELFTSSPDGLETIRRNIISQRTLDRLAEIALSGDVTKEAPVAEPAEEAAE
ncbi:MAG: trigger factor [Dehalococcoidia bacterium]|nr:trigger factor [Dehalococcoidia bacterium]MCB9484781.1 trigger factor [Thermoflexaceae bacterium]